MLDQLSWSVLERPLQLARDYSGIIVPLVAILAIALLVRSLSGSQRGSRKQGPLGRLSATVRRAFTTNWQLTLLATTAFVLSCASGWTTWDGMRNFTGEPILSFMITFGIQGVMLIIAWIIGESFATGMSQRPDSHGSHFGMSPRMATTVGLAIGTVPFVYLLRSFGVFSVSAPVGAMSVGQLADIAIVVGAALVFSGVLVALLLGKLRGEISQPYVQSARIIARNAVLWVMFLACMATSVFFSFDSLFSSIFPQDQRQRAAEIRSVNQVAGVVADIGILMQKRQAEEAEALFRSEGWRRYDENLARLARESQGAERLIEGYFVEQMEARRRAIAQQQERIATAQSGQAGLVARKAALTDELSRLRADRPGLASTLAEVKSELDNRLKQIDAKRVEAMAEDKGVEGTGKAGKGPIWRQRMDELAKMQTWVKVQEDRVKDAERRLREVDGQISKLERDVAGVDGDIAKLKGEAQTAERRIEVAEQAKAGDEGPKVDPARVRNAFERARSEFRQEPTTEKLAALATQCNQLLGAMTAAEVTKDRVRSIDCDAKSAAEAATRVFALNSGIDTFARNCAGGDKLPQTGGTDALLQFGRRCLQDSGLPSRDSGEMAGKISAIDLNRDDKAHRFVVTWNAFQDGNRLAYLALAIAIAIDSLVFMSGLFGANAVRSPLTDVPSSKARSAEQLEAVIDTSLGDGIEKLENLRAVLKAMHPASARPGFAAVVDPARLDHDAKEGVFKVLAAGINIGAVEQDQDGRFLVRGELYEHLAILNRRLLEKHGDKREIEQLQRRSELEKVVTVALLPQEEVGYNAHLFISNLIPIDDERKTGFTSEIALGQTLPDGRQLLGADERQRIMRVLNAGATFAYVQPVTDAQTRQRIPGSYYVHSELFKTLSRIRARTLVDPGQERLAPPAAGGALPPRRLEASAPPALPPARAAAPRAIAHQGDEPAAESGRGPEATGQGPRASAARDEPAPAGPRQQAASLGGAMPSMPQYAYPDAAGAAPEAAPPPRVRRPELRPAPRDNEFESSLRNQIRDELIQLGGLFPWDARDVAVASRLGEDSEPEAALRRLAHRAPRLGALVADAIDDYRASVRQAYQELNARNDHDHLYVQVLETVKDELERLMPLLILSPGGPYQQILDHMIAQLEPQSGDGLLSPADQVVLAQARRQVDALKRLADGDGDRLARVARIIDQYDELGMHVGADRQPQS